MNTAVKTRLVFATEPNWRSVLKLINVAILIYLAQASSVTAQTSICELPIEEAIQLYDDSLLTKEDLPCHHRVFLIAGFLDRSSALETVPFELRRSTRNMNAYDLAMIRTGDASRIRRLEILLEGAEVDDNFIYEVAPKLLYTRRREVLDFFFQAILSDERNCRPADAHTLGQINCAYRLLEMIAPVIKDFPLTVGPSGDLEVDDYPRALDLARLWISENTSTYQIITETY